MFQSLIIMLVNTFKNARTGSEGREKQEGPPLVCIAVNESWKTLSIKVYS